MLDAPLPGLTVPYSAVKCDVRVLNVAAYQIDVIARGARDPIPIPLPLLPPPSRGSLVVRPPNLRFRDKFRAINRARAIRSSRLPTQPMISAWRSVCRSLAILLYLN